MGCADMGGAVGCEPCLWGRRLWGTRSKSKHAGGRYANFPTRAARGTTSLWGTIRVKGVPRWAKGRVRTLSLALQVELPGGARSVRGACRNWRGDAM
eukprot:6558068-Pyramimonas_sp.AAC.1